MSQLFVIPGGLQENIIKTIERFFLKKGLDYKILENENPNDALSEASIPEKGIRRVEPIRIKGYTLNPSNQTISHKSTKMLLKKKEFELLHFMFLNRKSIIDRNTVLERVWGMQSNPFTNTVDVHISHLRRKLVRGGMNIIKTIYGVGYKLEV